MSVYRITRTPDIFKGFRNKFSGDHRLSVYGIAILIVVLGFGICPGPVRVHGQDAEEISLVQTIDIREYGGLRVSTDIYEVSRGDTLARILYKRGVIPQGQIPGQIFRMVKVFNPHLSNPDLIHPGQKLVLPEGSVELADLPKIDPEEEASAEREGDAESPEPETAGTGGTTVTVKKGDTLYRLLRHEGFSRGAIFSGLLNATVRLNPGMSSPHLIYEGQKIVLPSTDAPVTVAEARIEEKPAALPKLKKSKPPAAFVQTEVPKTKPVSTNPVSAKKADMPPRVPAEEKLNWKSTGSIDEAIQSVDARVPSSTGSGSLAGAVAAGRATDRGKSDKPVKSTAKEDTPKIDAPELPPSESVRNRTAISLIFTRMGERVFTKGQHFLPLKTGGQIIINNTTFPIIEMRSGRRVVLDLDHRLPEDMLKIIRANWSNYTIFRPQPKETLSSMLNRLFDLGQYYKLDKTGAPWIVQGRVTIRATADWIIWPTEEDYNQQRGVIVTILGGNGQETSSALAGYLQRIGIEVIDFNPKGNQIGPELDRDGDGPKLNVKRIEPEGMMAFIKVLLDLSGQKFESDLSIPLVEDASRSSDFKLTVQAPVYFTRHDKNHVVSVEPIAPEIVELLTKHKFEVIILPEDMPAFEGAGKLLAAMKIKTTPGLTVKGSFRPDEKNIEVTAPGMMMSVAGHDILLTAITIPESLSPLLARPNLEVIEYYLKTEGSPAGRLTAESATSEKKDAPSR